MSGLLLALDTSTEYTAVGLARRTGESIEVFATAGVDAPRAAMSRLLPMVDSLLAENGRVIGDVGGIITGRGPGSFTGVRIGVATAKGLAHGLGVPLWGVSTLDAIAWAFAEQGITLAVAGDAMRGEIYPALFRCGGGRAERLTPERVAKPGDVALEWAALEAPLVVAGNGLRKYAPVLLEAIGDSATLAAEQLWLPSAAGLFSAWQAAGDAGTQGSGDPGELLPVYTRLSDAEENERDRKGTPTFSVALPDSGVWGSAGPRLSKETLRPMRVDDLDVVVALEEYVFANSWTVGMFREELAGRTRRWLVAEDEVGAVVGYGGVAVLADGDAHIMNLAVAPARRGHGVGRRILTALLAAAEALGAERATLEVNSRSIEAISLYESSGFESFGIRPGYYGPGEDAVIMWRELARTPAPDSSADRVPAGLSEGASVAGSRTAGELILAIESSCDETAAAVMRGARGLLANVVASQVDFHARFGGVVPEIASRKHTEAIVGVVDESMMCAGESLGQSAPLTFADLDAIAVTDRPGLIGALVVGVAYAKGLAMATGKPLVGVNHLEGHIFANVFADPEVKPPLVALLVSGGHTSLVHMPEWGVYRTLGETLDDAAGEAFDKVAKVLGLAYPGGPVLSALAENGDPAAIDFPRAMMRSGDYSFSLSGLKTAVLTYLRHEKAAGREIDVPDLAASFQQAIIDVQVAKAVRAVQETGARTFCLGGGVAANRALRDALTAAMELAGVHVSVPPLELCTDNAAMIAAAAHYRFLRGDRLGLDAEPSASGPLDAV